MKSCSGKINQEAGVNMAQYPGLPFRIAYPVVVEAMFKNSILSYLGFLPRLLILYCKVGFESIRPLVSSRSFCWIACCFTKSQTLRIED